MAAVMAPRLPIPEPLRGSDPGSFASDTISERLPRIARRVSEENSFRPEVEAQLQALVDELPHGVIRPLLDDEAPDAAAWAAYIAPYAGQTWLEAPWFFVETYFYRRILEATGYFDDGPGYHVDPFAPHKAQEVEGSWEQIMGLGGRLQRWQEHAREYRALKNGLAAALWGNQADLSMWPDGGDEMPEHDAEAAQAHVLVDDGDAVAAFLQERRGAGARIDFIMDNDGLELAGDLALVDILLSGGWADSIVLDVKFHPTFVSDVMPHDIRRMMRRLIAAPDAAAQAWGRRLLAYVDSGRLFLRQHPFWTSPLAGWEMPAALRQLLSEATLVISKGDANYRRLLGDRHWDFTAPFEQVVAYFPAPLLALRTLKSNVAAGLNADCVRRLDDRGRNWVVSGEWGVMQFAA